MDDVVVSAINCQSEVDGWTARHRRSLFPCFTFTARPPSHTHDVNRMELALNERSILKYNPSDFKAYSAIKSLLLYNKVDAQHIQQGVENIQRT